MKKLIQFCIYLFLSLNAYAQTGDLFEIYSSGYPLQTPVTVTACLNAKGIFGISCQKYTATKDTLSINTVASNEVYYSAGIKVNDSDFKLNLPTQRNGYALLGTVSDTNSVSVSIINKNGFTVAASGDAHVTVVPPATKAVNPGSTTTFTINPDAGYDVTAGGTCGGTLSGNTYTTNSIIANCTVTFSSTIQTFTATATGSANVTVSAPTTKTVNYGSTTTFTITTASGYAAVP